MATAVREQGYSYIKGDPRVSLWDVLALLVFIAALVITFYHIAQFLGASPIKQLGGWLQNGWWRPVLWAATAWTIFKAWETSDEHDEQDVYDDEDRRPADGEGLWMFAIAAAIVAIISLFL